ncbi:MAG: hypothetical protein KF708_18335 [Pirellulales bacterium]|nr:hypothetical protein [Pirellulales bacterium]
MPNKKKQRLSTVVLLASTLGALPALADEPVPTSFTLEEIVVEPRENPTVEQPANRAELGRRGQGDKVNRLKISGAPKAALAPPSAAFNKQALAAGARVEPLNTENKSSIAAGAADGRTTKVQNLNANRKTALTDKDAGKINKLNTKKLQSRLLSDRSPEKSAELAPNEAAAVRDNPAQATAKQ